MRHGFRHRARRRGVGTIERPSRNHFDALCHFRQFGCCIIRLREAWLTDWVPGYSPAHGHMRASVHARFQRPRLRGFGEASAQLPGTGPMNSPRPRGGATRGRRSSTALKLIPDNSCMLQAQSASKPWRSRCARVLFLRQRQLIGDLRELWQQGHDVSGA